MGLEGGTEQRRDGRALAQGKGRHAASLVTAAIGEVADPLELIRRAPAPHEPIADPPGECRQQLDERPERLHRIVERRRLLEDRRRRPGAERAGILAPRELLQARPFTAEALEERGGGQGGQLAQRADAPAVEPRRHLGGRSRSATGAGARYAASLSGSTTVMPARKRQAKRALIRLPAMPTRISCPRAPAAATRRRASCSSLPKSPRSPVASRYT